MAVPCPSCRKPMSEHSIACPHCGARRPTGNLEGKLSAQEIRSMVITDADVSPSSGLFATLVAPHPGAVGLERAAEIVLTVACLPLVIVGTVAIAVQSIFFRGLNATTTGEAVPVLLMAVFGAPMLVELLDWIGVGSPWTLAGLSVAGLIVRGVIRARVTARHRKTLLGD